MTGTWPEGSLQLLIATGMLSQPLGAYREAPARMVMLEYATGWVLVRSQVRDAADRQIAAGVVNLLTGMVEQSLIRAQRRQADTFEVRSSVAQAGSTDAPAIAA